MTSAIDILVEAYGLDAKARDAVKDARKNYSEHSKSFLRNLAEKLRGINDLDDKMIPEIAKAAAERVSGQSSTLAARKSEMVLVLRRRQELMPVVTGVEELFEELKAADKAAGFNTRHVALSLLRKINSVEKENEKLAKNGEPTKRVPRVDELLDALREEHFAPRDLNAEREAFRKKILELADSEFFVDHPAVRSAVAKLAGMVGLSASELDALSQSSETPETGTPEPAPAPGAYDLDALLDDLSGVQSDEFEAPVAPEAPEVPEAPVAPEVPKPASSADADADAGVFDLDEFLAGVTRQFE